MRNYISFHVFLISIFLSFSLNASTHNYLNIKKFQNDGLNFVAIGDTGKGNEEQYTVAKTLETKCKELDCKFGILLGDNFYQVGVTSVDDEQFVTKFEKPYKGSDFPFYVALGNHDYGKYANDWKRGEYQVQYSQNNPKWILPSTYYHFEQDDILFLVLDTSRLFHNKDTKKQKEYFKKVLKENTKKWVIAIGHHPYISNGTHGNAGKYDGVIIPPYSGSVIKKFFEEDLCQYIDLYLAGHDHSLQTLKPTAKCPNTLFVVSGSGADEDELVGKNDVFFQKAKLGFTTLNIKENILSISHVNVDGETEHTVQILKSK